MSFWSLRRKLYTIKNHLLKCSLTSIFLKHPKIQRDKNKRNSVSILLTTKPTEKKLFFYILFYIPYTVIVCWYCNTAQSTALLSHCGTTMLPQHSYSQGKILSGQLGHSWAGERPGMMRSHSYGSNMRLLCCFSSSPWLHHPQWFYLPQVNRSRNTETAGMA